MTIRDKKKKKDKDFVPIGDIIGKTLRQLEQNIVPPEELGELYEMTDLYNARGLRIKGKKAVVIADAIEEVNIALGENFPLVVRNYGGTTSSKDGKFYPGCIFYVQNLDKANRIKTLAPQGIIPLKKAFPYHVTFHYRSWQDLIWLAQRFMREHFEKQQR
jgi:hypothetical protein